MSDATRRCYKSSLKVWAPFIADKLIDEINDKVIKEFIADRLEEVQPGSIRNDLAFLSSLMKFAIMLPGGPASNPVKAFDKSALKRSEERIRYLSPAEAKLLLDTITDPTFKLITMFGMEAGLRKMEILNLQMREVYVGGEPDTHHILLPNTRTKNGKGRYIPLSRALSRALLAHIERLKLGPFDWVFLNPQPDPKTGQKKPYQGVRPWFQNACDKIGLEDFHFHDTRHHFASTYVQKGGRLQPLQQLLGHKTSQMVLKYAHLAPGDAAREFRELDPG